jgi:hypothetical protein
MYGGTGRGLLRGGKCSRKVSSILCLRRRKMRFAGSQSGIASGDESRDMSQCGRRDAHAPASLQIKVL